MDGFNLFIAPALCMIAMFATMMPLILLLATVDALVHPEKDD